MGNGSQHPRIELIMRTLSTLALGILFAAPIVAESIPITTTSPTARAQFLEGRALFEKQRLQEARPLLQAAVAEDPNFALAWLNLAQVSTSAKDFFDHVDHAASLVDHTSEAEGWWITGFQAGVQGHPPTAVGALRQSRCRLPRRSTSPQSGRHSPLRATGLDAGDRSIRASHGTRSSLLRPLQHAGVRSTICWRYGRGRKPPSRPTSN